MASRITQIASLALVGSVYSTAVVATPQYNADTARAYPLYKAAKSGTAWSASNTDTTLKTNLTGGYGCIRNEYMFFFPQSTVSNVPASTSGSSSATTQTFYGQDSTGAIN